MQAWKEGRLADDIKAEHQKVREAQLIIFQVMQQPCLLPEQHEM